MLHQLAQTHPTSVRKYPHAEFMSEQQNGEVLVHATDPGRVDLQEIDRAGLQELLKEVLVLGVLSGGDRPWGDAAANGLMREHVVRTRGLLNPRDTKGGKLSDP